MFVPLFVILVNISDGMLRIVVMVSLNVCFNGFYRIIITISLYIPRNANKNTKSQTVIALILLIYNDWMLFFVYTSLNLLWLSGNGKAYGFGSKKLLLYRCRYI